MTRLLVIRYLIVCLCLVENVMPSRTHGHRTSNSWERVTESPTGASGETLSSALEQTTVSNATYREQFISKVLEQHVRYCGSNRVCQGRRPTRCWRCSPCNCDDLCGVYDDCCPDTALSAPSKPVPVQRPASCVTNLHGRYTDDEKEDRLVHSKHFFTVTSCPSSADSVLSASCVDSPSLPLVTSTSGNVTYLNKHCALCHGVDRFEAWNTEIDCTVFRNFQKFNSSEAVLEYALKQDVCWVMYAAPKDTHPRQCYVRQDMISSCNVTGNWTQYDEMLERACHSYTTVKVVGSQTYRNVFCFICNTDNPRPHLFHKCKKSIGVVSFSALLDFRSALYGMDSGSSSGCSQGQLYDGQRNACRDILCSQGKQLVNRTCVPIFGSAKGLGYEIYFDMISEEDLPLSGPEDLLHTLPARLKDFFPYSLNMLITFHDFIVAFTTTSSQGHCTQSTKRLSIYATFITTGHIDPLVFEEMLLHLREKNFTFQTEVRNISFRNTPSENARLLHRAHKGRVHKQHSCVISVSMSHGYQSDDPDADEEPDSTNPFSTDLVLIRVSKLLSCPQIRLEDDEFIHLTDEHEIRVNWKDVPLFTDEFEEDDMGVVRVCLGDFKPDALLVWLAPKEDLPEVILSIVCTSLSLVCLLLTFITYCLFKLLRRIPGKNNINLVMTLFSAQLLYLAGAGRTENKGLCKALGIFVHYLWLTVFCAMAVCSFHMFRVFSTVRNREDSSERRRKFLQYCVFVYGLPAILVVITLVVHIIISEGSSIGYGGNMCYLSSGTAIGIAFGVPVGLTVGVNLVFFVLTIRTIRNSPKVDKSKQDEHHVIVYIKLSTLTGITWIIGFLAFGVNWNVLRYMFIVVNASQGVFIFISFVCNHRVLAMFCECCRRPGSPSSNAGGTSSVSTTKSSASPFITSKQETKLTECKDSIS